MTLHPTRYQTHTTPGDTVPGFSPIIAYAFKEHLSEDFRSMLGDIDEECRKPFILFHQGFSHEAIAEQLSLPIGLVRGQIFFTRMKIKNYILQRQKLIEA